MISLVGATLLLGAAPAAAEDLPDGDFTAVYEGTQTQKGHAAPLSKEGRLEISCSGGSCSLVRPSYASAEPDLTLPQAGTITSARTFKQPDPPTPDCPELQQTFTAELTADASGATYTVTAPGIKHVLCNGDPNHTGRAEPYRMHFAGTLTSLTGQEAATPPDSAPESAQDQAGSAQDPRAGSGTGSRLDSGSATAPSVLSTLVAADDAAPDGSQTLALIATVIVLVLLIAFPTHLLNSAVDSGHERLTGWWQQRRRGSVAERDPARSGRAWAGATGVVLIASLIGALADPGFGFNSGSLRLLVSLAVALAIESILVWFAVIWLVRRVAPGTIAGFRAAPATLLIVALAVLLTRLTGFEPAIVFGLVAGVAFGAAAGAAAQGKVSLAGLGLAFALAVLGWVGYSVVGQPGPDASYAAVLVSETLSALAIAGIASLPLVLIPLRGLAGHEIYAWSKALWAACYAVALTAFFLVLMPMPFSWSEVDTPLRTWVLLYLAYALTAVAVWALVTKPWADAEAPQADRERVLVDREDSGAP